MKKLIFNKLLIICFAIIFSTNAYSGDSWAASALNVATWTDQHDQRGFTKNSTIAFDGNLSVSRSNATVMYQYPIENYTSKGSNINVSLNYCGSVKFTSLACCYGGASIGGDEITHRGWKTLTQNRPAWIIGVNGFAVQTLHCAANYICNPALQKSYYNGFPYRDITEYNNEHMTWLIDGYDFCNSLCSIQESSDAMQDVIKLLRSDGSILELKNAIRYSSMENVEHNDYVTSPYLINDEYFSGRYYVNSVNAKGMAIVEYMYPRINRANDDSLTKLPSRYRHLPEKVFWDSPFRPRICRYFPGDGMEYIFHEYVVPYGLGVTLNSNPGEQLPWNMGDDTYSYGILSGTYDQQRMPKIFYLVAIRNHNETVAVLDYSRHEPNETIVYSKSTEPAPEILQDGSMGRGLFLGLHHIRLSYGNPIVIHNFNKEIKLYTQSKDNVVASGTFWMDDDTKLNNTLIGNFVYFHDLKDNLNHFYNSFKVAFNEEVPEWNKLSHEILYEPYDGNDKYFSWNKYIDLIVERGTYSHNNSYKETRFEYTNRLREFNININSGCFPVKYRSLDYPQTKLSFSNRILTKIIEPDVEYDISYNLGSVEQENPFIPDLYAGGNNVDYYNYMNDVVDEVKTYDRSVSRTLLKTEDYGVTYASNYPSAVSCTTATDDINKKVYERYDYSYIYQTIPDPVSSITSGNETYINHIHLDQKIIRKNNGEGEYEVTTQYKGYNPAMTSFWVDTSVVEFIKDKITSESYPTSNVSMHYTYQNGVRDYYNGVAVSSSYYSANDMIGKDIDSVIIKHFRPDDFDPPTGRSGPPETVITKEFDHLPLNNTGTPITEDIKLVQSKILLDDHNNNDDSYKKGDSPLHTLTETLINYTLIYPPIYNLPVIEKLYDGEMQILTEKTMDYETNYVTNYDDGNVVKVIKTLSRGKLLSEQLFAYDPYNEYAQLQIPETQYNYYHEEDIKANVASQPDHFKGYLESITNPLGAEQHLYYDYKIANDKGALDDYTVVDSDQEFVKVKTRIKTTHDNVYDVLGAHQYKKDYLSRFNYYNAPVVSNTPVRKYDVNQTPLSIVPDDYSVVNAIDGMNNVVVSFDPNNWASTYAYDSYHNNVQVNLPYDFFDQAYPTKYEIITELPDKITLKGTSTGNLDWQKFKTYSRQGKIFKEEIKNLSDAFVNDFKVEARRIYQSYAACDCMFPQADPELRAQQQIPVPGIINHEGNDSDQSAYHKTDRPLVLETLCSESENYFLTSTVEFELDPDFITQINSLSKAELKFYVYDVSPRSCFRLEIMNNNDVVQYSQTVYSSDIQSSPIITDKNCISVEINNLGFVANALNNDGGFKVKLTPITIFNGFNHFFYSMRSYINFHDKIDLDLEGDMLLIEYPSTDQIYTTKFKYSYRNDHYNPTDNKSMTTTVYRKIDDNNHSSHTGTGASDPDGWELPFPASDLLFRRQIEVNSTLGPYYQLLKQRNNITGYDNSKEITYDGFGQAIESKVLTEYDEDSPGVFTPDYLITQTEYNGFGEPKVVTPEAYADPSTNYPVQYFYQYGTVADFENIDPTEDYFGTVKKVSKRISEKELNTSDSSSDAYSSYYDAKGRLRMEIQDVTDPSGGTYDEDAHKVTKYEYDFLDRLIKVINPKSQTMRYWYDPFGRIKYKYHPDFGVTSYAYDDVGNVRFEQTQNQADKNAMTYYEYDDLNRMMVTGEAKINELGNDELPVDFLNDDVLVLNRFTDLFDPSIINHNVSGTTELTTNISLWTTLNTSKTVETRLDENTLVNSECIPIMYRVLNDILGINILPYDMISHQAVMYDDIPDYPTDYASASDFENIDEYPEFVRTTAYYDTLPPKVGKIWEQFPDYSIWNSLAPPRVEDPGTVHEVRNLKGRLAAIAYREHGGQPFNYMVFSYDERGRVEALLRYTDNLGFDAVYYTYNSMDLLTTIRIADPFNQYITWYDYDELGRLSKVWTSDPNEDSEGLCQFDATTGAVTSYSYPALHNFYTYYWPEYADVPRVEYAYNYANQLNSTTYPEINTLVEYAYNDRILLTNITATDKSTSTVLFQEDITYDDYGQGIITGRISQVGTLSAMHDGYEYDDLGQLGTWRTGINYNYVGNYEYDAIGNRTIYADENSALGYHNYGNPDDPNDPNGPNRLNSYFGWFNDKQKSKYFTYNSDGELSTRLTKSKEFSETVYTQRSEEFSYDYRGLLDRYIFNDMFSIDSCFYEFEDANRVEWQYWYNPFNEREQKRMYYQYGGDERGNLFPWVYYLLGPAQEQYAVYYGMQLRDELLVGLENSDGTDCDITNNIYEHSVYMYPGEYNTYGTGSTVSLTWKQDNNTDRWGEHYNITDHLGSVRAVLKNYSGTPLAIVQNYYRPFGQRLEITEDESRLSFIGKENDNESWLGDFGVRKYDEELGRFTSTEPLWEKYYGWSPYHYSSNNPIMFLDPSGLSDFLFWNGTTGHLENGDDGAYFVTKNIYDMMRTEIELPSGEIFVYHDFNLLVGKPWYQLPYKKARTQICDEVNTNLSGGESGGVSTLNKYYHGGGNHDNLFGDIVATATEEVERALALVNADPVDTKDDVVTWVHSHPPQGQYANLSPDEANNTSILRTTGKAPNMRYAILIQNNFVTIYSFLYQNNKKSKEIHVVRTNKDVFKSFGK